MPMMVGYYISNLVLVSVLAVAAAAAEHHTVHFVNQCGLGTPILQQNGQTLSTGADYTSNGSLSNAVAFLQIGGCGPIGQGCITVEMTLENPTSTADIALIPPYALSTSYLSFATADAAAALQSFAFMTPIAFEFTGARRTGSGASCTVPECSGPGIEGSNPNDLPIVCDGKNVGITITFCE
ncbi:glycopeptide [Phanerochaete sordida]|uniref:Glycopeptide n=1 Tax=Phanerochaete sordida TaxID=48140 RepID=A0A9P3LJQ5_9APHY|nr:glycopeptide [Phanerochaete sordida]